MDHDPGAGRLGDLARSIGRIGVDDEQLIEQRMAFHQFAPGPLHDDPDRLLLVERREHQADGQPLLALEVDQAVEVAELAVVEVRFAEPALDPKRDRTGLECGTLGGSQRLGPRLELLERGLADRLTSLDDDDRLAGASGHGFGQRTEQERLAVARGRRRRSAHDHDIGGLGLTQDGVADVDGLAHGLLHMAVGMLADEVRQGPFRLRPDALGDAPRHEVQGHDLCVVAVGQGVGEAQGQLRVRAASDRHQDGSDLGRTALLYDRDSHGASRATSSMVGEKTDVGLRRGLSELAAQPKTMRSASSSVAASITPSAARRPDADDGVDRHAFGSVVEDAL